MQKCLYTSLVAQDVAHSGRPTRSRAPAPAGAVTQPPATIHEQTQRATNVAVPRRNTLVTGAIGGSLASYVDAGRHTWVLGVTNEGSKSLFHRSLAGPVEPDAGEGWSAFSWTPSGCCSSSTFRRRLFSTAYFTTLCPCTFSSHPFLRAHSPLHCCEPQFVSGSSSWYRHGLSVNVAATTSLIAKWFVVLSADHTSHETGPRLPISMKPGLPSASNRSGRDESQISVRAAAPSDVDSQ